MIKENIKRLRIEHGLNQQQLAEKLGYKGRENVSRWESGDRKPNLANLLKIAGAFDVSIKALLEESVEDGA